MKNSAQERIAQIHGVSKHLSEAFTRQHYIAIAAIIKSLNFKDSDERDECIEKFCALFQGDNAGFNAAQFTRACR